MGKRMNWERVKQEKRKPSSARDEPQAPARFRPDEVSARVWRSAKKRLERSMSVPELCAGLKEWRTRNKISAKNAALRVGAVPSLWKSWESGHSHPNETYARRIFEFIREVDPP